MAYWHGPEEGARVYCCDACWPLMPGSGTRWPDDVAAAAALTAASEQEKPSAAAVSEAQVDAALKAWNAANKMYRYAGEVRPRSAMRAALTAALQTAASEVRG